MKANKVNLVNILLISLSVLTIFVSSISCHRDRGQRGRGHGKIQGESGYAERAHKRSTNSKYLCEETEEDIQRLNAKMTTCKCPPTYAPVCGSDGQTYHNRCFINCAAEAKYQRFYHDKKLTIVKMEPCGNDH